MIITGHFYKGPEIHEDDSGLKERRMVFENNGVWEMYGNFHLAYTREGDNLEEGRATLYKHFNYREETEAAFQEILKGLASGKAVLDLDEEFVPGLY